MPRERMEMWPEQAVSYEREDLANFMQVAGSEDALTFAEIANGKDVTELPPKIIEAWS